MSHHTSEAGIFLSYRREDAAPYARLLQFHSAERFPTTRVFLDLDSIEAGLDFAEVIRNALNSTALLVALIGRQWTSSVDEEGRRRLDNPGDYVRYEINSTRAWDESDTSSSGPQLKLFYGWLWSGSGRRSWSR
jgi:hypothetical protein